jgi:hypothetical protein
MCANIASLICGILGVNLLLNGICDVIEDPERQILGPNHVVLRIKFENWPV